MKNNKHIQGFGQFNENLKISDVSDSKSLTMIFGDDNTVFKKFDDRRSIDRDFLKINKGKVYLDHPGFSEKWHNWVDFDRSYAYINSGKLYVVVYGLPDHLNKKSVHKYFGKVLEQYIKERLAIGNPPVLTFDIYEHTCVFQVAIKVGNHVLCHPICMVVERDGKELIV